MIEWGPNEKSVFIEEVRSSPELYKNRPLITEKIHLIMKNYNEENYVELLFDKLSAFLTVHHKLIDNEVNPTDQQLISVTGHATILYESRLFRYILDHSMETANIGVYYFEKVSAHERSMNLLLKFLLYGKEYIREIYKSISWKLIPSIEVIQSLPVTTRETFDKIFIKMCNASNEDIRNVLKNITSEEFYNKHLQRMKKIDNNAIQSSCTC